MKSSFVMAWVVVLLSCLYTVASGYDPLVHEAQIRLNMLGYSCGEANGEMGSSTFNSIKNFQFNNHIEVTGVLNDRTMNALGVGRDAGASKRGQSEGGGIVEQLRSNVSSEKRLAARTIYKLYWSDPKVIAAVNDELTRNYATTPNDWDYVDALSWMCNILGASNDVRYMATLRMVRDRSPSNKLMRYAAKNLTILESLPQPRYAPPPLPPAPPQVGEAAPPRLTVPPVEKLPDPVVKNAQENLRTLGYDPGAADGFMGTKTHEALKFFQHDNKLPTTGKLDAATSGLLDRHHSDGVVDDIQASLAQTPSSGDHPPAAAPMSGSDPPAVVEKNTVIGRGTVVEDTDLKISPDPYAKNLATLPAGESVEILVRAGLWLKVRAGGMEGFVLEGFLQEQ